MNSRRFAGVFGTEPDAIVSRPPTCVRSGPNLPVATVPLIVWQLMHALCMKTLRPSATAGSSTAGCRWCSTQAANSSGVSA